MNLDAAVAYRTPADRVHEVIAQRMLSDGLSVVFDPIASHGPYLVDARTGAEYLDLFSFFASHPIGHNHKGMADEAFLARLLEAAAYKPTCSDVYTQAMADFVETFSRTLPKEFTHLFFIEGGALAVENALKVAFDWKVRKNQAAGRRGELGSRILHFERAFHGRTGYTLSLTNTFDPRKTQYFPKFDWPRVCTPGRRFPESPAHHAEVRTLEQRCMGQIREALEKHPHDIAAIILETIQGEGGDVHFRTEFLQKLRDLCDREDILLIFDEVQCGMGLTGTWWAFQNHGVAPDIFSFGKKTQVCGIAATSRIDDVENVFKVPSRINSTWGGNLVDMVRCQRYIEVIESDGLLANAKSTGAYALEQLRALATRCPGVSNVRGEGLMCAFDLPSTAARDDARRRLFLEQRVIMLASGAQSLRFRPTLDFSPADVDVAVERIEAVVKEV